MDNGENRKISGQCPVCGENFTVDEEIIIYSDDVVNIDEEISKCYCYCNGCGSTFINPTSIKYFDKKQKLEVIYCPFEAVAKEMVSKPEEGYTAIYLTFAGDLGNVLEMLKRGYDWRLAFIIIADNRRAIQALGQYSINDDLPPMVKTGPDDKLYVTFPLLDSDKALAHIVTLKEIDLLIGGYLDDFKKCFPLTCNVKEAIGYIEFTDRELGIIDEAQEA